MEFSNCRKDVLSRFSHIFIYSPHYDDAFLSLGGYLGYTKNKKNITVVILFGLSNRIDKTDVNKDKLLYASSIRRAEEEKNIRLISGNLIVYDNLEAIPRGHKRSFKSGTYPHYISPQIDSNCQNNINAQVGDIISKNKNALHLFPLSIGGHVDHQIVKNAVINYSEPTVRIGFYEDMPYACKHDANKLNLQKHTKLLLPVSIKDKITFLLNYKSQEAYKWIGDILKYMLFIDPSHEEYAERIWLKDSSNDLTQHIEKKIIHFIYKVDTEKPFHKSSGIINHYMKDALTKLNFKTIPFHRKRIPYQSHGERLIPLENYSLLHKISMCDKPDYTFYDDHGLAIHTPKKMTNHHNIVFFHGFRGNPGIYFVNNSIDLYCCNSPYFSSLLRSNMLFPNFENRTILDPRGVNLVTSIRLPVPFLDYPNGYDNEGEDLPREVEEALMKGFIIGHSVQRDKPNPKAIFNIMKFLNSIAKEHSKQLKLVVNKAIMPELITFIKNSIEKKNIDEYISLFIPMPLLNNKALLKLMRKSKFGLAYNRYPESFGIYPLESVLQGCPIYTNGIGNNRYLLPPENGIVVYETEAMVFENSSDYNKIAKQIFDDIINNTQVRNCQRGATYISNNYSKVNFEKDVENIFQFLNKKRTNFNKDFSDLIFTLSPLVRSWNYKSKRIISDYKSIELEDYNAKLINELLEVTAEHIKPMEKTKIKKILNLFYTGILTLT